MIIIKYCFIHELSDLFGPGVTVIEKFVDDMIRERRDLFPQISSNKGLEFSMNLIK
jgi:hypothetical protein